MASIRVLRENAHILETVLDRNGVDFLTKLAKTGFVTEDARKRFLNLDEDSVDSKLRTRYLLKLISKSIDTLKFSMFTEVLSQFTSFEFLVTAEREGFSPTISESIPLKSCDINFLAEILSNCSHKWEEIGIVLGLPKCTIDECRSSSPKFAIRLFNILTCWQEKKTATMKIIKLALESESVGMPTSASSLMVETRKYLLSRNAENLVLKVPACCNDKAEKTVQVLDGKSVVLAVSPTSESCSYKWEKDGQCLPENSEAYDDILVLEDVCQGLEGEYTCTTSNGDAETTKKISLTISFEPLKKCLLEKYKIQKEMPKDSWPPVGTSLFINLALVCDKNISRMYDYSVRGDMDDILKQKELQHYTNLFGEFKEGALVLVEGRPGSGKTTLTHKLAWDWGKGPRMLKGAKYVFLVSLRMLSKYGKETSLSDALEVFYNSEHLAMIVKKLENSYGEGACFILDGLDEYHNNSDANKITELMQKKYLHRAMVIVASRPSGSAKLRRTNKVTERIEVLGFSRQQISRYISTYTFTQSKGSELETTLESYTNVLHMCYLPVHVAMICYIYDLCKEIPNTETKIYEYFTLLTIKRMLERDEKSDNYDSLDMLDGPLRESFEKISDLAFDMTINGKQTMEQCKTEKVQLTDRRGCDIYSLGLVTVDSTAKLFGVKELYAFLHLTFQEFLAAFHLTTKTGEELQALVSEHQHNKNMRVAWKFYCGLMKYDESKQQVVKMMMNSKELDDLSRIHCVFESQHRAVCNHITTDSSGSLTFRDETFSATDHTATIYACTHNTTIKGLTLDQCRLNGSDSTCSSRCKNVKTFLYTQKVPLTEPCNHLYHWLRCFPSLEVLDISNVVLTEASIRALTDTLRFPHLRTIKFSFAEPMDHTTLKTMSFGSTVLEQVHYSYFPNVGPPDYHRAMTTTLQNSFKCKLVCIKP